MILLFVSYYNGIVARNIKLLDRGAICTRTYAFFVMPNNNIMSSTTNMLHVINCCLFYR